MNTTARKKAIAKEKRELRDKLWPEIAEDDLWNRQEKQGFTTIPRTMPLFMEIMDSMSNGKPVSFVYFNLWCIAFDEHMIELKDKEKLAFYSGYSGQRAVNTWNIRIDILNELGFIRLAPGPYGERSYALLLNPYHVIQRHYENDTPGISKALYNSLLIRAKEIGADDI